MAFSTSVDSGWSMLVALLSSAGFWLLDAFFLRQNRLCRCLFDGVRKQWPSEECDVGDIDLSTKTVEGHVQSVIISPTVVWFHLTISVSILVVAVVLFD